MSKLNNAVVSTIPAVTAVGAFDAVVAEQSTDIVRVADMLVSVERAESDVMNTSAGIADLMYGVLISQGEPVGLGWYDAVRLSFGDAYRSVKGDAILDNSVNQAWARVFKLVSDSYGLTKPKAEGVDAERKAEQRAKKAELLAAYETLDVVELKDKAKALYNKAGDGDKKAKKEADLVVKAIELRTKEQSAKLKEESKALKVNITALLKQVTDISVLGEVLDLLQGSVDDAESAM
jgi:hypothetical protein